MVTVLTSLTQLIIYNKKHNLNNSNFLLSGKDTKYKLKLPIKIKIHLMFYISLLQPLKEKPLIYKVPPPPPIIIDNGDSSYFINSIDNIQ